MREWIESHLLGFTVCVLAAWTMGMLVLLVMGISSDNLVAAVIAGMGMAVAIVVGGSAILVPDDLRSRATERTLRVASGTLRHMAEGLTPESAKAVCQLLLPETSASAIAMTDDKETLAFVGLDSSDPCVGEPVSTPTRKVLESGRMQTFARIDQDEEAKAVGDDLPAIPEGAKSASGLPVGVVVPLEVSGHTVGTVKLYYRHGSEVDRTQLAIARGFAELLSTQLSVYELDRQAELTARAEVKALQAQINPHFLFNALNTIAALTRTDPARARDLLREFSAFYRQTLTSSQQLIPLREELGQTRRYLTIEKARFGEDRILEEETVQPGLGQVMVPGFIVQPVVENAVRHAMREEGPLHIDVQVVEDGGDVLIAVADDGNGMSEEAARRLLEGSSQRSSTSAKGTGVALRNVAERLERFFGKGSGVEIMSKPGEGTCVTLRLAGVAPKPDM